MKKTTFLLLCVFALSLFGVSAQDQVYRMDPVTDAYSTPESGKLMLKTKDNLPRMADYQTKYIMRFDPFFFAAENPDVQVNHILKAEVLIISVLEGGLTGTSRRVNDAEVMVYEVNNSWARNEYQPDDFEIEPAIAGPIYYPAVGANDGTEEFMAYYQTPVRIDITDFFKQKFVTGNEFSIDFIKSSDYTTEFTRMGGVGQSNEDKRSHMLITYNTESSSDENVELSDKMKVWSSEKRIHTNINCDYTGNIEYSLLNLSGQIVEKRVLNNDNSSIVSEISVGGIYFVKLQIGENTVVKKVVNK